MRRLVYAALLILAAGLALSGFAPRLGQSAWRAGERIETHAGGFQSTTSTLAQSGGVVRVEGTDAAGVALALHPLELQDVSRVPVLRYRLQDSSAATRALFLWVVDGRLESVSLPRTLSGEGTLVLGPESGWQGRVDAIGIGVAPVDYLEGTASTDTRLGFVPPALESPSWSAAIDSVLTQWSALRPWSGRSINTGGFELGPVPPPSLQAWAAMVAGVALLLVLPIFGRAAVGPVASRVVAVLIVASAIHLIVQLAARAVDARAATQRATADPKLMLAASPPLAREAARLAAWLSETSGRAHVLVVSESRFEREQAVWLLREHDVAGLEGLVPLPVDARHDGLYLVFGTSQWDDAALLAALLPASSGRAAVAVGVFGPFRVHRLVAAKEAAR